MDTKIISDLGVWVYNLLHTIFNTVRTSLGANADIALLAVAVFFAYYFNKKSKENVLTNAYVIIILSIVFFILLRYI